MSLGSQLIQGPKMKSLIGDFTRFHQESVAVMVDIKSMYHQVKVARYGASSCLLVAKC